MLILLLYFAVHSVTSVTYYDSYRGQKISSEELNQHKNNNTFWCTIAVEDCDPEEWKRIDGTCNNLQHPSRGAQHNPFYRMLPDNYNQDFRSRKSKSDLPLVRYLRTSLIPDGTAPDQHFTTLVPNFLASMSSDISSAVLDTVNYVLLKRHCCAPEGRADPDCSPIKVPDDDPVHRFSEIRCLNVAKPLTFQTFGCISNATKPERIVTSTPVFDLSQLYGEELNTSLSKSRLFERGLMKFEVEQGRIWPPSTKTETDVCLLNQKPYENRCHDTAAYSMNSLLGINLMGVWFYRLHNKIANELADLNPCWDDHRLFYTARDINIAISLQIYLYELLPLLMGRDNMMADGLISPSWGFRNMYNKDLIPEISLEFPYALRWVHLIQDGRLKMYDTEGHYLRQYPIVNLTGRTGFLAVDNNIDYITQGTFRQPTGKLDYMVDLDIGELGLGPHQRATDVLSSDLLRNRDFGFPPYIEYLKFCFGRSFNSFEDLAWIIDEAKLEMLKELYSSVEDVELLAGMWVEKPVRGGVVPPSFYCILAHQLKHSMAADRHWYESEQRPHAFTLDQLHEIRKYTASRFLCDVGDKVTEIQPSAFRRARRGNEITSCKNIPNIDWRVWKDDTCGVATKVQNGAAYQGLKDLENPWFIRPSFW